MYVVNISPQVWDPFQMAPLYGLYINGCDPNHANDTWDEYSKKPQGGEAVL